MENVGSFPTVMSTVGKEGEQYGCENLKTNPGITIENCHGENMMESNTRNTVTAETSD